jgi:short-subunit dehydrogenase
MSFFQGKTTVVTGAGSGIGRALAHALADAGVRTIVITDIFQDRIDTVKAELEAKGVEVDGYKVDHSKFDEVRAFADSFFEKWGHVDILCQNAGVGLAGRFLETSLEEFQWIVNINLWGVVYMLNLFVPKMVERHQGSILITDSDAGIVPLPFSSAYNMTKFAVAGLGETMRIELSEENVKLTLLCPGDIKTNVIKDGKLHLYDSTGRSAKPEIEKYYEEKGADPAVVAAAALRGLEKNKPIVIVPWSHHGYMWDMHRLSPWLYHKVMAFLLKIGVFHKMMGMKR